MQRAFEQEFFRRVCRLAGTNGNTFAVIGRVRQTLVEADQRDAAMEFVRRAALVGSHDELLVLCSEYVVIG